MRLANRRFLAALILAWMPCFAVAGVWPAGLAARTVVALPAGSVALPAHVAPAALAIAAPPPVATAGFPAERTSPALPVTPAEATAAEDRGAAQRPMRLRVVLSERKMYVIQGGRTVKTYPVAIGRPSNPTPTGQFRTGRIEWNPSWTPPPRRWARGLRPRGPGDPRNPMQGVKIYFREPWYYIHGTNDPESIGQAASRGCIRMRTADAVELARRIQRAGGRVPLEIVR